MSKIFQGHRVQPNAKGLLDPGAMDKPGAYGRITADIVKAHPRQGQWQVTCPDGSQCSLNPDVHTVTEHEDGTISVHPSIDLSDLPWNGWHGWLKKGVFESV